MIHLLNVAGGCASLCSVVITYLPVHITILKKAILMINYYKCENNLVLCHKQVDQ